MCTVCGSECSPRLNNLQQGVGGCKTCARTGFDPSKPAFLYLISGSVQNLRIDGVQRQHAPITKVGIANDLSRRIRQHAWHDQVLDVLASPDGAAVARWERQLKGLLAAANIATFSAINGHVSKNAETWETSHLPVTSLREMVKVLEAATRTTLDWPALDAVNVAAT